MSLTNQIEWILPEDCISGTEVNVCLIWTPIDESVEYFQPPSPPMDDLLGFWSPVPQYPPDGEDRYLDSFSKMVSGTVIPLEDDPEFLHVALEGEDVRIPWGIPFVLAKP